MLKRELHQLALAVEPTISRSSRSLSVEKREPDAEHA
jgi:hypothetical protein